MTFSMSTNLHFTCGHLQVVVEEACEVMEPTLISVLAVKSLKKLELIGDHRQLPAFIQNCWYNLQTTLPSIKTSLFERLIDDVASHHGSNERDGHPAVPHTVLDEQRRMRSSIADITRHHYADVVKIVDHPQTALQVLGDAVTSPKEKKNLQLHRPLWKDAPRDIPGVRTNVFFWDLKDNKLSRSMAGLSACNETEANAATELTKYLLLNGVPPSCISIITPYKGQKGLLIKKLRAAKCIPGYSDTPPPPGTILTVSTVDRYQGDENDIIIYSNVRPQAGNKFVTLKNRFIVTTSRARLGFFLLGSVSAVKEASHWKTFIESLERSDVVEDDGDDNSEDDRDDDDMDSCHITNAKRQRVASNDSRVGSSLPICCPRHRGSVRSVESVSSFPTAETWGKFCSAACTNVLSKCGHTCPLTCHSPTVTPHVTQNRCQVALPRPCLIHPNVALYCQDLKFDETRKGMFTETLATVLSNYQCQIPERYTRPECNHVVERPCYDLELVKAGEMALPSCVVKVADFIQPECGHKVSNPTCSECRAYEIMPPKCMTQVKHKRPCGCEIKMTCHDSVRERSHRTLCQSQVTAKRPR